MCDEYPVNWPKNARLRSERNLANLSTPNHVLRRRLGTRITGDFPEAWSWSRRCRSTLENARTLTVSPEAYCSPWWRRFLPCRAGASGDRCPSRAVSENTWRTKPSIRRRTGRCQRPCRFHQANPTTSRELGFTRRIAPCATHCPATARQPRPFARANRDGNWAVRGRLIQWGVIL